MSSIDRQRKTLLKALAFSLICITGVLGLSATALRSGNGIRLFTDSSEAHQLIALTAEVSVTDRVTEPSELIFPVYITGEIISPGVYQVTGSTYLFELIDEAGGLTDNASAEALNLAMAVEPNSHVHVPSVEEWDARAAGQLVLPGDSPDSAQPKLVNINTATQAELETLPGVGQATASAIISFREQGQGFGRIEDLMQVPGIKEAKFAKVKDFITVG